MTNKSYTMQQNEDGSWSPATALPLYGWRARLSVWCLRRGLRRVGLLLAAWDERGLGS